jgi:hypothetical protein
MSMGFQASGFRFQGKKQQAGLRGWRMLRTKAKRYALTTARVFAMGLLLWMGSVLFLGGNTVKAGTLPLPEEAKGVMQQIAAQCDQCLQNGFAPTGTAKIGFGKKFFANFFQGEPSHGILISYTMPADAYLAVLRQNTRQQAMALLQKAFSETKLFVVEKQGYRVHGALSPKSVEVILPEPLHKCLNSTAKPLCCCCTDCASECCEKKLGSTSVAIRWDDPFLSGRTIIYTWYPHAGASMVRILSVDGKRAETRWCLDSAGPGRLQ